MTDHDLEEQLTAMFGRRATDVRTAPQFDFSSAAAQRTRLNLTPLAVAASIAAVVISAGATVVGIRSIHQPSPNSAASSKLAPPLTSGSVPSSRPTTCAEIEARTTWQTPIDNGTKVALDHPDNTVVSVNSTIGDYLLLQTTPPTSQSAAAFGQATLAIFHGTAGQDVAVLPSGSTDVPTVDPAGAITPDWIAYGFAPPQNAGTYYKVMLYNRRTRATTTVAELSPADLTGGRIFSAPPVIFGGKLYWIQSSYSDRSQSRLESYDLETGARDDVPAPGAVSLVYYGVGVATITGPESSSVFTTRLGAQLPSRVLANLQGATAFTYKAPQAGETGSGVLHWVRTITDHGGPTTAYYTNDVGDSGFSYGELTAYSFDLGVTTDPFLPVSPIAGGAGGVQEGRMPIMGVHPLPSGDVLQATVGDTAIFGTGSTKLGSSGLVLVKISALPHDTAC